VTLTFVGSRLSYGLSMYVPSLVKIHWRMLILECSQGCYVVKNLTRWPRSNNVRKLYRNERGNGTAVTMTFDSCFNERPNKGNTKRSISPRLKIWPGDLDLWPWKSIGFQIFLRTKYVPSLVKMHWKMLILVSQECYRVKIRPCELDLWPWKSLGFQILLMTKYVPSLVKIHWRMLILECSQGCYGRTDGRVTISLRNFVGEGIKKVSIGTKIWVRIHCVLVSDYVDNLSSALYTFNKSTKQ
jgi:hypothetical protein